MATGLNKQVLTINFQQGLDLKTDPKQVQAGKFLALSNSIFDKAGLLAKRNGFGKLTALSDASNTFLTTFNGNLTAIGTSLNAYSSGAASWVNKGTIQPVSLDTLPLIRSSTNQSQCDAVVASNGLVCTVYTDVGASTTYKYAIADSVTGQNIVAPVAIPVASGTVTGPAKVFALGNYFVIVFDNVITATHHLQFIAININSPTSVVANTDISTVYVPGSAYAFSGVVANNSLYICWNSTGTTVKMNRIDSTLTVYTAVSFASRTATHMSLCADTTGTSPIIYAAFYDSGGSTGYVLAVDGNMTTVLAPTQWLATGTILNVTCAAQNQSCTIFYEVSNAYSYDSGIASNYIKYRTVAQGGSLGTATTLVRSVGLASRAFIYNSVMYFLGAYSSAYQPSYFLFNSSGSIIAKLAYSNGGGYTTVGLPNVTVIDDSAYLAYLTKDLVAATNKTQGAAQSAPVYSQLGINLAAIDFAPTQINSVEIGSNLNISGGLLWAYDGYSPVEQNFNLWPDSIECTWSATGGSIVAKPDGATNTNAYFYQVCYEWADNQGNVHRSAPSVPVAVTTTGAASTGSITINVPYLRLTYKTANPVKIVVYRWSVGQQTYYAIKSPGVAPTLNDTTADSVAIVDTLADASIIGNPILYTTGNVVENIGPPAAAGMTLFKSRLFMIDAEDKNLLWFSKQVIEATPVEMSDLLTFYVAPTIGAQGSTGIMTALSVLDDKLIIFKRNAIYYVTGTGPNNTGGENDFSDPVLITATVGCTNQNSIIFTPQGLMFQSDKGIWILGRDLQTTYIGAPVENYNSDTVQSAVNIPGTNQVRFTLDSGVTLMYDYFFGQWGTFTTAAISSTLYQNLHTYINSAGQVFQETPGLYLDGSNPVLMSFTTSWLNLAGLQGLERAYHFLLLGEYISPHKLIVNIAYDYAPAPSQQEVISPDNYNEAYGGSSTSGLYGSPGPYGGNPTLEDWRIFFQRQKVQSFQIQIAEQYDGTKGVSAGAGLTLSGLSVVVGIKKGYNPLRASRST